MSGWQDVVTTALLGTDRRPLPHNLPASWGAMVSPGEREVPAVLLDLAAARRALTRAGAPLPTCPPGESGPTRRLPRAPEEAQALLGSLLSRPRPELLNLWLAACAADGWGVGAEHWVPLATAAARSAVIDRARLAQALGPRGVWFLGQRPAWARLAEDVAASARTAPSSAAPPVPAAAGAEQLPASAEQLPTGTGELLDERGLLPAERVPTALRLLASGALGTSSRAAGVLIGLRLPVELFDQLPGLLSPLLGDEARLPPGTVRAVRDGLLACEQVLAARVAIGAAFRADAGGPHPQQESP